MEPGGWVDSEVFDHTSVLRFLETWTGIHEPNISAWRRAICGDLTSCFDFAAPRFIVPMLPDTTALRQQADATESKLPSPTPPPLGQQTEPVQDSGSALARALPYQPGANVSLHGGILSVDMENHGDATLQLGVYAHHALQDAASRFDMKANGSASTTVPVEALTGNYDVEVHGPNGFVVHASGAQPSVEAELRIIGGNASPRLRLSLHNVSSSAHVVNVHGLRNTMHRFTLGAHDNTSVDLNPIDQHHGWYDLVVSVEGNPLYQRRYAGHLENGQPSRTGPN